MIVDLSPTAIGGHVFKSASSGAASTILLGSDGNDSYTLGGVGGLDALGNVTIDARGGASDALVIDDRLSVLGNPNVDHHEYSDQRNDWPDECWDDQLRGH